MLAKHSEKTLPKDVIQKELSTVTKKILSLADVDAIYAIGSASRYEMRPSSDIDIVVLASGIDNAKDIEKTLLRARLTEYPLDLIVYETSDFQRRSLIGGLAFIAANDGLLLFEKKFK